MANQRLDAARIATLYEVTRPAYLATVANASLLVLVLWHALPPAVLLGWLALVAAVALARITLQRAYARSTGEREPGRWQSRAVTGALCAGLLWTFPPVVFLPVVDPLLQLAVIFLVGGNIVAAAGVYAASPAAFVGFSTLPFAAVVAQLGLQGGRTYPLLALTVGAFGIVILLVYRGIHRSLMRALRSQIENQDLVGRLARSENKLQDSLAAALVRVDELQRAEEAYRRLAAEEDLVLDTLPVGVAFLAERVIVRCNQRLEQMLGYGAGELNGKPVRVLYASEAAWREAGGGYDALRNGKLLDSEMEVLRKDGGRLWCSLQVRSLDDSAPQASAIVAFSDIGERHAAAQALRKSEAMYRNLVETSNDLVWSVDGDGRWTYLSPAAARRIYGRPSGDLIGRPFLEMLSHEVAERDLAVFRRILGGDAVFDYQTRHLRQDGGYVDLSFNAVALRDAGGTVIGATGTARDVTEEKAAAAAQFENVEKLRLAVDAAELTYWEWDRDADQLHWGRDPSTLIGPTGGRNARWSEYLEIVHPEDRERYLATVNAAWEQAGACSNEYRVIRKDGRVAWLSSHGKTLADGEGKVHRMIGVSQDITERKRQEEEARFLAYHDTLTGLPNRRLLDDRLRQAVFLAQRRDLRVAVMVVDLDRFKQVNDTLGHRAGDAVLREAAHRIAGCVRKADTLARHGGDEFVVMIPDLRQDGDCQVVAEKILRALEPPFRVDERDFVIGASIGVSLYPSDAGDGEGVLRNADVAMYRAKQIGGNNYRFYGR
jgi:diguanylate cyclase (GGDEF)-like protein/PAS domain S-box-containing protein